MIKGTLPALSRWLRRTLKGLLGLVAAYPFLLVVMYYTTDAFFSNGAELWRSIDWQNRSRGDLNLPNGQLIARNVGKLCWNETSVSGWKDPEGFVWSCGDQQVIQDIEQRSRRVAWVARRAHAKAYILPVTKQNHYSGSGDPCGPMHDDHHHARQIYSSKVAKKAVFARRPDTSPIYRTQPQGRHVTLM